MVHLQGLRVDFSHSGLALQRSCLKQLFGSLTAYSSITNLTSLKLTELPRIDEHVLSLIATGLPNLVDAQFISIDSLDMECCPNCYEDSLTRISHSPVSDMYSDVIVLAVSQSFRHFSMHICSLFCFISSLLTSEGCLWARSFSSAETRKYLFRNLPLAF